MGQVGVAHRGKRSKYVYLPANSSDSMDYKETPAGVAMSASQLGEYAYRSSLAEESESAFIDAVESDSFETGPANADSDSSETELDKDDEMTTPSGLFSNIHFLPLSLSYAIVLNNIPNGHNLKRLKEKGI